MATTGSFINNRPFFASSRPPVSLRYEPSLTTYPSSCEPRPDSMSQNKCAAIDAALSTGFAMVPPSLSTSFKNSCCMRSTSKFDRAVDSFLDCSSRMSCFAAIRTTAPDAGDDACASRSRQSMHVIVPSAADLPTPAHTL